MFTSRNDLLALQTFITSNKSNISENLPEAN